MTLRSSQSGAPVLFLNLDGEYQGVHWMLILHNLHACDK